MCSCIVWAVTRAIGEELWRPVPTAPATESEAPLERRSALRSGDRGDQGRRRAGARAPGARGARRGQPVGEPGVHRGSGAVRRRQPLVAFRPRDEAEGMMAAQTVELHQGAMGTASSGRCCPPSGRRWRSEAILAALRRGASSGRAATTVAGRPGGGAAPSPFRAANAGGPVGCAHEDAVDRLPFHDRRHAADGGGGRAGRGFRAGRARAPAAPPRRRGPRTCSRRTATSSPPPRTSRPWPGS